jgi:hypothetical protein
LPGARDEWGEYETVGCECGQAIDLDFDERAWRGTRLLDVGDVPQVLSALNNHAIR